MTLFKAACQSTFDFFEGFVALRQISSALRFVLSEALDYGTNFEVFKPQM